MPTKKAQQKSEAARRLRTQIRDLICEHQEITNTDVGLIDCIITMLDGTVTQDLRNRVHGALILLEKREEIVLVKDSTYNRAGTAQQSAIIGAKWVNGMPLPPNATPAPPIRTSNVRDAPPQQAPAETPEAPKPTRTTPHTDLLNYVVQALRERAKETDGKIKGGVRPITRDIATWLPDTKLSEITKELVRLGYVKVDKKGGPNTIVSIDFALPLATPEQVVQAKTGPVVRDEPAQEPEPAPTPEPEGVSEPEPEPTPDSKAAEAIDESTLAAILVTTEEISTARDKALEENAGLRQRVAAQECSNHELRQQLTALQGDHEAQGELLEDVDRARSELAQKLGAAEQQIADLKKDLEKVKGERGKLQEELDRQVDPAKAVLERLRNLAGKPTS